MTSSLALVLALLFTIVNAGKFSLPVSQEKNSRGFQSIHKRHENTGAQSPLRDERESTVHPFKHEGEDSQDLSSPIEVSAKMRKCLRAETHNRDRKRATFFSLQISLWVPHPNHSAQSSI